MKYLAKCAGGILLFAIALTSCQQENLVAPDEPSMVSSPNMREAMSPTKPKFYQLTKRGTSTLSYYDDGKLKRVTFGPAYHGTYASYIAYTYSANTVVTKLYGNNKLQEQTTYLLQPATGNCFESQHKEYVTSGPVPNLAKESSYIYQYSPKGQLMTRKNKNSANDYTDFFYDTDGKLNKVSQYGDSGKGNGSAPMLIVESNLIYTQSSGQPLLDDHYPINCEFANMPDPYLRVFGKPTKYLVKLVTEKGSLGGRYFSYTLNADGYPVSRQMYNISGGALMQTIDYDYVTTGLFTGM